MASNILFLPFRKSHQVSLSGAMTQYISSKYDQHPDMFAKDLETIDSLRREATYVREPHSSGIRKLQEYAAQLVWIGGKFPIDIGADFTWYPALGYHTDQPVSQNNLRFELSNILYNLAALYSQLAVTLNRSTSDGLKSACNYFCLSAGVISYLRSTVIPDMRSTPAEDMDTVTLESLEYLMLAQAQECIWQKALMDKMRDSAIAKLSAKICDHYAQAADCGIKSDSISTDWLHHINAKHHHFAAAAQYRAALDCLERRQYGEEIARLKDSLNCVNEALSEGKWISKLVLADSQGLKAKVQDDIKRAEKDNDMIYHAPIPDKSQLKKIDRASIASPRVPKEISDAISMIGERGELGKPLFSKLVPFAVHAAESIYTERRDRVVNDQIISELDSLNAKIHDVLSSLNLPGSLQALERPLGLPPGLVSHAEEIRQQDGLNRFYRSIEDTARLRASDEATYHEAVQILDGERAEDDRFRAKYGTERWTRPPSNEAAGKLFEQLSEFSGYLKSAEDGDQLVMRKLRDSEKLLVLLSGSDRDLEKYVPSSRKATMTPKIERHVEALRDALSKVSRVESRRRRKVEAIRDKAKRDDISHAILAEAARLERENPMQKIEAVHFELFFTQRLKRYDMDIVAIGDEEGEQDDLLRHIEAVNADFVVAQKGETSSTTRERQRVLQQLEDAYVKYNEIASNLDTGRKFYNDLAKMISKWRDQCKAFAQARRVEAGRLENDISTPLSALSHLSLNSPPIQPQYPPQHAQYPYSNTAPRESPLPAPVPQRQQSNPQLASPEPGMWNPELGIKFGGPPEGSGMMHQQQAGSGQRIQPGVWNPNSGLKFG